MNDFYKIFIWAGIVLIVTGLFLGGKLGPFGRLPGDVIIDKGNFKLYFPITTAILISIILSIIFKIFNN